MRSVLPSAHSVCAVPRLGVEPGLRPSGRCGSAEPATLLRGRWRRDLLLTRSGLIVPAPTFEVSITGSCGFACLDRVAVPFPFASVDIHVHLVPLRFAVSFVGLLASDLRLTLGALPDVLLFLRLVVGLLEQSHGGFLLLW